MGKYCEDAASKSIVSRLRSSMMLVTKFVSDKFGNLVRHLAVLDEDYYWMLCIGYHYPLSFKDYGLPTVGVIPKVPSRSNFYHQHDEVRRLSPILSLQDNNITNMTIACL